MNLVAPNLYIGDARDAASLAQSNANNIIAILDCRGKSEGRYSIPLGVAYIARCQRAPHHRLQSAVALYRMATIVGRRRNEEAI
jgi:hypothetical protein